MSCESGRNEIVWWRGQRKALRLQICNPPSEGIGAWTFAFYLYDSLLEDATLVLTKTTGFTVVETGGADMPAVVELLLLAADTSTLEPGTYYHKWVRADNGIVIDHGPFILNP